jgi:hypothetical protein
MNMIFINHYHTTVALTLDGHILAREVVLRLNGAAGRNTLLAPSDQMPTSFITPPLCI